MRFNIGFTRGTGATLFFSPRIPAINHACSLFIENKRYTANPRVIGRMVNRNADSVYQTECGFGLY
jgi:hypothetical protein